MFEVKKMLENLLIPGEELSFWVGVQIVFPSRVLGYMGGGGTLAGILSLSFLEL